MILSNDISVSILDSFKNEILEELKKAKYKGLKDMVYGMHLTYDQFMDILYLK